MRDILGLVAVLLTFAGYVPYLRDILKGVTKPHIYSWFLWGFVTSIAFALQVSDRAGAGAFVTLAAAILCLVVFVFGILSRGHKDIAPIDALFLVFALLALVIWLFAKQPVISALLTATIDMLGFMPTIRKSWNKPYSETVSFYFLNTLRFFLTLFALQRFTLITASYPTTWLVANGLFACMLMLRRQKIPAETAVALQESGEQEEEQAKHRAIGEKGADFPHSLSGQGKINSWRDMLADSFPFPVLFFKQTSRRKSHAALRE